MLCAREHFAVQGLPAYNPSSMAFLVSPIKHLLVPASSAPEVAAEDDTSSQRIIKSYKFVQLAGNGMHLSVVGTVLCYGLASIRLLGTERGSNHAEVQSERAGSAAGDGMQSID